jgi:hypothetical protein
LVGALGVTAGPQGFSIVGGHHVLWEKSVSILEYLAPLQLRAKAATDLGGIKLFHESSATNIQILIPFIKIFQNTPQLCWGDEWPPLSPGGHKR